MIKDELIVRVLVTRRLVIDDTASMEKILEEKDLSIEDTDKLLQEILELVKRGVENSFTFL